MSDVPDVNQCMMPSCEAPKADCSDEAGLCADHLKALNDSGGTDTDELESADPHTPLDSDTVREHYDRAKPAYEALSTVSEYPTLGLDDKNGWYITRDCIDIDPLEEGYTKRRRPASMARDLRTVLGRIDRTFYGLTTFKTPDAVSRWKYGSIEDGEFVYAGNNNATPDPEDLRAVTAWGDIDLNDELKLQRGDLDEATRATAEATLDAYIQEFATLVGGRDAVYALDSVGGAYIFTAPAVSVPIYEHVAAEHDDDLAAEALQEVIERSNNYLSDAQERVEERVDGAADVIDPDWANNHNRKYKAPLSIHGDHAAVVTPLNVNDVDYWMTPLDAVDDDLIAEAREWAAEFTALEHTDRAEDLVATLWADEYAEHGDWRAALDAWVAEREAERDAKQRRQALRTDDEADRDRDLDLEDLDITPYVSDVEQAIDRLDIYRVADDTIVHRWTEDLSDATDRSGSGKKAIVPTWANGYNSGNATYVDESKGTFVDTANGDHGTAVEMALVDAENWSVGDIARGRDWARGVRHLQELGYDIPVWTPDAETAAGRDEMPFWSLRRAARALGVVDEDDFVERESDGDSDDTYLGFPDAETYNATLEAVEEAGFETGRDPASSGSYGSDEPGDQRVDPRHRKATTDPRRAWTAAGRVTPAELDEPLPFDPTDDAEAWTVDGERVDVVRAVALEAGLIDSPTEPLTDAYSEAYSHAREGYGAPLPAYYTTADAIAEFDAVLDIVSDATFWDLDAAALDSEVTERDDEVSGEAVRALDPTWRESESGSSVLVFESGTIWDADTERSLDLLRFVALDVGLLGAPGDSWDDGEFTTAYQLARDTYGVPLPRWEPATDGERDHTAQLPGPDDLVDTRPFDGVNTDALSEARANVEALLREAMTDDGTPTVIRALPATGKTTGTVKTAEGAVKTAKRATGGEGVAGSYLTARLELQKQALETADQWGVEARVLPVFSEKTVDEELLTAAVNHVREAGKDRLHDRWGVLAAAAEALGEDPGDVELFGAEKDNDAVDLDRPTCETADGKHGDAWGLAVHVARRLGYTPREIHTEARGLFGAPIPCMCDEHGVDVSHLEGEGCEYSLGWRKVADPDDPVDLLIGSYVHAHVESARTYYERDEATGRVRQTPRAVVLDEFVGEAFSREFGDEALDFATWLAASLRKDVDDRRDMFETDLAGDDWIRAWLDGDGGDHEAVAELTEVLARYGELYEAKAAAAEIRREVGNGLLEEFELLEPLTQLSNNTDVLNASRSLRTAVEDVDPQRPGASIVSWVDEAVREPLSFATCASTELPSLSDVDTGELPIGGDLVRLVDSAVEAVQDGDDSAPEAVRAATTALRGGRDGCRRLAAWADDGYAHPDAHHLLEGVITPTDADSDDPGARRVDTDAWAFDPEASDGTVVDVVDTGARARTLVDRNGHGAILHTPPAREAGNGEPAPLVGLDATGRRELWETALLEDVVVKDIHDTDAERARFLEEALDLRVIRAADQPRPYEGDPTTKDTDGDVALIEALADEYSGISAPRACDETATTVGNPAVVTTKGVRNVLEDDDRLEDTVPAWEHFGNHTGSNDLGSHRLAALLGSQHYGDHAVERFAALGGESVDTERAGQRGADLTYGNELGDAYLAHMRDDQTMQAILRFARGDSGATVVARTSALRDDLPVVARAQVVETWTETATTIARQYRRLGDRFTAAAVADRVDVSRRQVRRVLAELTEAGYIQHLKGGDGTAKVYTPVDTPGAGEVDLPDRGDVVSSVGPAGHDAHNEYYTWDVRVEPPDSYEARPDRINAHASRGGPPAPGPQQAAGPPG